MKTLPFLFLLLLTTLAQAYCETNITNAANYLISKQTQDGQFDQLGVYVTAPSIVALRAANADKYYNEIQKGAKYIASKQRQDGCISQWCSKQGHIPDETGISLWALAETNNLNLLPDSGRAAIQKIKESQTPEGDFASDEGTNTEHTTWALISLSATHSLTQEEASRAINYIGTHWQEKNGAIKRADDDRSGVNGPQQYYTALTVWALAYANQTNNSVYQTALANLITRSENCFDNSTHVLTIATAKLALDASNVSNELDHCTWQQQHPNGGLRDSIRASATENSFDTGFVLLANANELSTVATLQTNETNSSTIAPRITIKIIQNNNTQVYNATCERAIDCLKQIANVTCKYYSGPGLTCKDVNQACFIEQINGQPNQTTLNQWSITQNDKLSDVGISCITIKNNDVIEIKLQTNFDPYALRAEESSNSDYLIMGAIAVVALIILITLAIKKKEMK